MIIVLIASTFPVHVIQSIKVKNKGRNTNEPNTNQLNPNQESLLCQHPKPTSTIKSKAKATVTSRTRSNSRSIIFPRGNSYLSYLMFTVSRMKQELKKWPLTQNPIIVVVVIIPDHKLNWLAKSYTMISKPLPNRNINQSNNTTNKMSATKAINKQKEWKE